MQKLVTAVWDLIGFIGWNHCCLDFFALYPWMKAKRHMQVPVCR